VIKKTVASFLLSVSALAYSPSASASDCLGWWAMDVSGCVSDFAYSAGGFIPDPGAWSRFARCMSTADFNYDSCSLYNQ
jgi:hypothetical protein